MTDDKDDDWDSAMTDDGGAAAKSKDILRKARALNPNLASQGSTTELFEKMQPGAKGDAAKATPAEQPARPGDDADLVKQFSALRKRFDTEHKRIEDAQAALEREKQALSPKALEAFVAALLKVDPNMTSPQTKELLRSEARFLDLIGFTVRKFVQKKFNP